jgi:hypothetical protein
VTNFEKIAILSPMKGIKSQLECGGLMKDVELAIGAPASVMVTLNIDTDLDVANK